MELILDLHLDNCGSLKVYEIAPCKRSYEFINEFYFLQFPWIYIFENSMYGSTVIKVFGSFDRINSIVNKVFVLPIAHNCHQGLCLRYVWNHSIDDFLTSNYYYTGYVSSALFKEKIHANDFLQLWQEDVEYMRMFVETNRNDLQTTLAYHMPGWAMGQDIRRK